MIAAEEIGTEGVIASDVIAPCRELGAASHGTLSGSSEMARRAVAEVNLAAIERNAAAPA